jgi:hypothetical protein
MRHYTPAVTVFDRYLTTKVVDTGATRKTYMSAEPFMRLEGRDQTYPSLICEKRQTQTDGQKHVLAVKIRIYLLTTSVMVVPAVMLTCL